jgi:hypothetical protein
MACYRGEYAPFHPQFPTGSKASCQSESLPAPIEVPDIAYTREDEKAIDEYNRKFGEHSRVPRTISLLTVAVVVQTAWHSVSTA